MNLRKWTLVVVGLFVLIMLLTTAFAKQPDSVVKERFAAIEVGKAQTCKNLTMYPLIGASYGPGYITLDEALSSNKAEVLEKGSGEVPTLVFSNKSADRILLMDGEELVGARQNRILNTSILIGPRKMVEIPVSCVEQGRWVAETPKFRSGGTQLFSRARQSNNEAVTVNMERQPSAGAVSNQSQIWSQVAAKRSRLNIAGSSEAMHDAYVQKSASVESYVRAFKAVDGQVGCIFAINGRIVGADIFSSQTALRKLLPKITKSYSLDAISEQGSPAKGSTASAEQFLLWGKNASMKSMPSVGEGRDIRLLSSTVSGAALVAQDAAVHISLFARPPKVAPVKPDSMTPLQRPSRRYRNSN
jgi:hypothetical protein